jgi:hypothetical protein
MPSQDMSCPWTWRAQSHLVHARSTGSLAPFICSRNDPPFPRRIEHVYTHVYLPIIDGSVSTILAVLMLGSSDFNFVRLYFFLCVNRL